MLLDLLLTGLFVWLVFKVSGLVFRVAWSLTKLFALVLFVLSIPALVGCLLFAGGLLIVIPVAMVGMAFGLLNNSI